MKGNWHRDRSVSAGGCLVVGLQRIRYVRESDRPRSLKGRAAYPTRTSTWVTKTSLRKRRATSDGSAASKNRESASTKFALASSIEEPWLAISNSGQRDTKPSSSRSMMAVRRRGWVMIRVYNSELSRAVISSKCRAGHQRATPQLTSGATGLSSNAVTSAEDRKPFQFRWSRLTRWPSKKMTTIHCCCCFSPSRLPPALHRQPRPRRQRSR